MGRREILSSHGLGKRRHWGSPGFAVKVYKLFMYLSVTKVSYLIISRIKKPIHLMTLSKGAYLCIYVPLLNSEMNFAPFIWWVTVLFINLLTKQRLGVLAFFRRHPGHPRVV